MPPRTRTVQPTDDDSTIEVADTANADPRQVPAATVPNVRYRDGYAPGDTAKATLYQRFGTDRIVESDEAGEDGFRGTVVVQEGDIVTPAAARLLAEQ